jgi:endoglucanase
MKYKMKILIFFISLISCYAFTQPALVINDLNYFETPGVDVFVFSDNYPEGHQGGIEIIQQGERVAANGDLWLEPTPGQWSPFSQVNGIVSDTIKQSITVSLAYPNKEAAERKFNRITYPDLNFNYSIVVKSEGRAFRIIVNLDKPLPKEWIGKVGFNLELFPAKLFNKTFLMDGNAGTFPRQLNGPFCQSNDEAYEALPLAEGHELIVAPESDRQRITISSENNILQLIDGRAQHNNGWFVVRSVVPAGTSRNAIEWLVSPNAGENWKYAPVIHSNQVGYLPNQEKSVLIECDKKEEALRKVDLVKVMPSGIQQIVLSDSATHWGRYLHFNYYRFDFTKISEPGIYFVQIDTVHSSLFRIGKDIYNRDVWQPTLEYFLPIQMCHMRVNDRYKIWHGLCHMDDAEMAPTNYIHFDGYMQGSSTLGPYQSGEHVPGINRGGWHDAGDYDLRVESQAGTIYALSLICETFDVDYDITTIKQTDHLVEMHQPDGKPDILQQIEHGAISIVGGYQSLGRIYRGIISRDLRQYVTLGDGSTMTDNIIYSKTGGNDQLPEWLGKKDDDRWVFTEANPRRYLQVSAGLAAASRTLKKYNDTLSLQCLDISKDLFASASNADFPVQKIQAIVELFLTTNDPSYLDQLLSMENDVVKNISEVGSAVSRVINLIDDNSFHRAYMLAMQHAFFVLKEESSKNPFGLPYKPSIWGYAWNIERFGVEQYYLYKNLHNEESKLYLINALNYVLGMHPGMNTASLVSGVGNKSATVAYGVNRDDWSYIPGGVISGTAYIKPDFPELKEWPYLWQQTEYMISGASENFIFLVLAIQELMK